MHWKSLGRERSLPNFKVLPRICMEEKKKTTKNLSKDSQFSGRDTKLGPPEHEARVLTTRPRRSIVYLKGSRIHCSQTYRVTSVIPCL
jgi:hypothetical protein